VSYGSSDDTGKEVAMFWHRFRRLINRCLYEFHPIAQFFNLKSIGEGMIPAGKNIHAGKYRKPIRQGKCLANRWRDASSGPE
jgi:hypothetical protein